MNTVITPFRLEHQKHYTFYESELRIVDGVDVGPSELKEFEAVISKNYIKKRSLIGKITGRFNEIEGKLYEKLLSLDLPLAPSTTELQDKYETVIISFVHKYSIPWGTAQEIDVLFRDQRFKSRKNEKVYMNWPFIPFESDLTERGSDFFRSFWFKWLDFKNTYEAVKSGDENNIFQMSNVINMYLKNTYPVLKPPSQIDKQYHVAMEAKTCLSLCYLELYNYLISHQTIKACPYCEKDFATSKSNRTGCVACRTSYAYKKRHYYNNIFEERRKARERMRKNRVG